MTDTNQSTNMSFDPTLMERARNAGHSIRNYTSGNEWLIFFISFLIYISDIFLTKFDGVDLYRVYASGAGNLSNLLIKGIIINSVFWIVLATVFFIKRPENPEEFISRLLLIATVFLIATLTGLVKVISFKNIGSLAHLLVIIFGIRNVILSKYSKTDANYYTIFFIFLDFFLFNILHSIMPAKEAILNRVIIPILPIMALIFMEDSKPRSWILFLLSLFYILVFMHTYNVRADFQGNIDPSQVQGAAGQAQTAWERFKSIFTEFGNNWEDSKKIISGDYDYNPGQVEDYETEPLGVFLEDVEASDSQFIEGENIKIWATLKAYTLEDNKIDIEVTCLAKDGTKNIPGKITPKERFSVESYDEEFITCTFDKESNVSKNPKYYTVIFNATFNFKTQSYLKTYYIEKERLRILKSENIDVFNEFEIADRNPTARYTNGPLKVGMGTTTPPVGIPIDKDGFSSYIGITLDNNWGGKLIAINNVTLDLPAGLSFDTKVCNDFKGSLNKYNVNKEELNFDNQKEYILPKSFKCSLSLDNPDTVLGNSPLSIRYFSSTVDYKYQITEKTTINVKKKT